MAHYIVQRWNDGGDHEWHVFEFVKQPQQWWQFFPRYDKKLVHKAANEVEAIGWMQAQTIGQYDLFQDYDATGKPIYYGY